MTHADLWRHRMSPVQAVFVGRSQPFLVGLTPNQDAYDANTHLKILCGTRLSVWKYKGVLGPPDAIA